jgi:hypothetical protein
MDLSPLPPRRTLACYAGGAPKPHVSMEIFLFFVTTNKQGNQKKDGFSTQVLSEVREHPHAHPQGCQSLRRTHSYGNLPYNKI